jgi:hypothetical protein
MSYPLHSVGVSVKESCFDAKLFFFFFLPSSVAGVSFGGWASAQCARSLAGLAHSLDIFA